MGFTPPRLLTEDGSRILMESGQFFEREGSESLTTQPGEPLLSREAGGYILLETGGRILLEGAGPQALEFGTIDDDAVFPEDIAKGARGGPGFRTEIQEFASGGELRISLWSQALREFDVAYGIRQTGDVAAILSFYRARRGPLRAFRFRDPFDWSTHTNNRQEPDASNYQHRTLIGAGDGNSGQFQLVKRYRAGEIERIRPIARPIRPGQDGHAMHVFLDGVEQTEGSAYTVDYNAGRITFASPPGEGVEVRAAFTFHILARFSIILDDAFVEDLGPELTEIDRIPVTEVKENVWFSDHRHRGGYVESDADVLAWWITLSDGFVQKILPGDAAVPVYLPRVADLVDGGPICVVINGAAAASGKTLTLRTGDAAETAVATLAEGAHAVLSINGTDGSWRAVK